MQNAPVEPATCSADLCDILEGYCPNPDDDESANNFHGTKSPESGHMLEKRGKRKRYPVEIASDLLVRIIAATYPPISALFRGDDSQVLDQLFQLIPGYCTGRSVNMQRIVAGHEPTGRTGQQTEHVIDVRVTKSVPRIQSSIDQDKAANYATIR